MKKIYKNRLLIIFSIVFVGLYACMKDECYECDKMDLPESLSMSISLSSSQKLRATRALPTEAGDHDGTFNENKVETLDLFFYQDNRLECHVAPTAMTMSEVNETNKNIIIPITDDLKALMNADNTVYDIYVVANNAADLTALTTGSPLSELQAVLFSSAEFVDKGGAEAQTNFVMDGKLSGKDIKSNPDLGKVDLKRVASKIRLRIVEIDATEAGYTFDENAGAQARLVHFLNQSTLLQDGVTSETFPADESGWETTAWRNINTELTGELDGKTTVAPFYAYANDWNVDVGRETFLELKVPFVKDGIMKEYFYRVPITPITSDDADATPHLRKLERNFLYDIAVKINDIGASDDKPVQLEGNYVITDWAETEVAVEVFMFHYLMVTPSNAVMANTNTIELDFLASVAPVQYKDLVVSYTYVDNETGQPVTENITSGSQYANIVLNDETKKITITSAVPTNFIPKDITFTVYTEPDGLPSIERFITLRQVPATYFTTEKGTASSERPTGNFASNESNLNNKHMYIITSMASDDTGNHRWGFPPRDVNSNTIDNASVAKMISPKFMMASQLGATSPMYSTAAKTHCKGYWEISENGVKYEDWRLPTEAEIKYIDDLQHHEANVKLGYLMDGRYYWDSYFANNAYKMKDPGPKANKYTSFTWAHVRCIRDVKE